MDANETFLNSCKLLVNKCGCQILIVSIMGMHKAYIVSSIRLNARDVGNNEVSGAQDITDVVKNGGMEFMTRQFLQERIQSIPVENFCFSTDDYILFSKVSANQ